MNARGGKANQNLSRSTCSGSSIPLLAGKVQIRPRAVVATAPWALSLTPEEKRHLRASLQNLRRAFGTWACLADAMRLPMQVVRAAGGSCANRGSIALAYRAAQTAGISLESILTGKLNEAGRCPTCGSRIGEGRVVGGSS